MLGGVEAGGIAGLNVVVGVGGLKLDGKAVSGVNNRGNRRGRGIGGGSNIEMRREDNVETKYH